MVYRVEGLGLLLLDPEMGRVRHAQYESLSGSPS